MSESTPSRLLRMLSLLQMHRDWTGRELAGRLEVTTRTIRRDMDRLRELRYPVQAAMGPLGGYRLGAGAALPPLLLDDDEAVAVTLSLQADTTGNIAGIDEAALRALTKVERVLPSRLRHRVHARRDAVIAMPPRHGLGPMSTPTHSPPFPPPSAETLRFDYRSHTGAETLRSVEPHRLAHWNRRWYLVGRVEGIVTPIDEHTCRLEKGSDSYALVARVMTMLNVEFEVESPPELVSHLQALADRLTRATRHE